MKTVNLHGARVEEADKAFHEALNEARLKHTTVEREFIVGRGRGIIRHRMIELATLHGVYVYVPMHNEGVVVIEFE